MRKEGGEAIITEWKREREKEKEEKRV